MPINTFFLPSFQLIGSPEQLTVKIITNEIATALYTYSSKDWRWQKKEGRKLTQTFVFNLAKGKDSTKLLCEQNKVWLHNRTSYHRPPPHLPGLLLRVRGTPKEVSGMNRRHTGRGEGKCPIAWVNLIPHMDTPLSAALKSTHCSYND